MIAEGGPLPDSVWTCSSLHLPFLYTISKLSKKETKKTILFTIATKIKCLGIHLTKDVEELYN
jgi:hypothetical protein